MVKAKFGDQLPPEWMSEEETRAEGQAGTGKLVNESAVLKEKKANTPKPPSPQRVLRGWRPSRDRAAAFDVLVAEQKNSSGKNGPALIDEALDLLFERYNKKVIY